VSEKHHIISFTDRHQRIRNIAEEIDAYLKRMEGHCTPQHELHKLRGYCEQLRVDAESLKNGADGFGRGVEEVTSE